MKIQNKAKHAFQHSYMDAKQVLQIIEIQPGEVKDIPEEVAKVWLKMDDVVEFVEPKEAKALEDENAKLKAELEKLKKPVAKKPAAKKTAAKKPAAKKTK